MKKLIEAALPLTEINAKTIREKKLAPDIPLICIFGGDEVRSPLCSRPWLHR